MMPSDGVNEDYGLNAIKSLVDNIKSKPHNRVILTEQRHIDINWAMKKITTDQIANIYMLTRWVRDELRCSPGGLSYQKYPVRPNGICGYDETAFEKVNASLKKKGRKPVHYYEEPTPEPETTYEPVQYISDEPSTEEETLGSTTPASSFQPSHKVLAPLYNAEVEGVVPNDVLGYLENLE